MLVHKSRTKSPRNWYTRYRLAVAHATNNNAHQFQGQKVKGKVTRPITAETESVSYLLNVKAYKLQNWYRDGACTIKACEVGFLHGGIPYQSHPLATQLVFTVIMRKCYFPSTWTDSCICPNFHPRHVAVAYIFCLFVFCAIFQFYYITVAMPVTSNKILYEFLITYKAFVKL